MHFLNYHYNNIIKYDFLNKFYEKRKLNVPKIKKVCLSFSNDKTKLKELFSTLFALELITVQKGIISKSKTPQISIKMKKGGYVCCKITLREKKMYLFLEKLFYKIFPKIKLFSGFGFKLNKVAKTLDFVLPKLFYFSELESHYKFFQKLPPIQVSIIARSENSLQTFFFIGII